MTRVESSKVPRVERKRLEREFLGVLETYGLSVQGQELLRELLMDSEVVMFARRLRIARALMQGHSYRRIVKDLKVGLDTIEKVHQWLDVKCEDYRSVLLPLRVTGRKHPYKASVSIDPLSFRALRRRYPAHMLLFNLLLGDPRFMWVDGDEKS